MSRRHTLCHTTLYVSRGLGTNEEKWVEKSEIYYMEVCPRRSRDCSSQSTRKKTCCCWLNLTLTFILKGWGWSSMDRASDRHAADEGTIPPVQQGILLPEFTFNADSLCFSIHPSVQLHALTSVRMLKILHSMSEFGGLWKHENIQHAP